MKEVVAPDAGPADTVLDEAVARHLDRAVAQLVEEAYVPREYSSVDTTDAILPRLISLGPPTEPSIALVCGRLPQQLADFRFHLRTLGSYVDSLQATLTSTQERAHARAMAGPPVSFESLEVEHSDTMGQARLLLSAASGSRQCASECGGALAGQAEPLAPLLGIC